jgi:hypothetical protein
MNNYRPWLIRFGLLVAGVFIGTLLKPEKIKVEKVTVEKEVEVIKEVEVEKKVFIEKEKIIKEKKIKREIILPDGTIMREEIYESNQEQLDRLVSAERNKVKELTNENLRLKSKIIEKTNPKRLGIYAGFNPINNSIGGGANYSLVGPITVGAMYFDGALMPTIGVRF